MLSTKPSFRHISSIVLFIGYKEFATLIFHNFQGKEGIPPFCESFEGFLPNFSCITHQMSKLFIFEQSLVSGIIHVLVSIILIRGFASTIVFQLSTHPGNGDNI